MSPDSPNAMRRLLRAYALLGGCCDDQRALVGTVSRRWIGAESERYLALADLPPAMLMSPRGREIVAAELYHDPDVGPEDITAEDLRPIYEGEPISINSNRLPKLEPTINAAVLAGVMLTGVRLYGAGGRGRPDIDEDLVLATLVQSSLGHRDRLSAWHPDQRRHIDRALLEHELGPQVAARAGELKALLADFVDRVDCGETPPVPPAAEANALAALLAGLLRLSARAAGDQILRCLLPEQAEELRAKGMDPGGDFAERACLARDLARTRAALALPGVDRTALREPLSNTLLLAVQDALDDPGKRARLVGRRGKAVHEVHLNLPLMEYYNAAENPDALVTIHVAALEMMRYLDKCRRKSCSTMIAHAFQITRILERHMGDSLDPSTASAALLHDVVEDGARDVAGYDQSLQKLRLRFGGPLAAMVSEVTDSNSRLDGPRKAATTHQHSTLLTPRRQYDVSRFTEMPLRPTDADTPYTLAGIVMKLADTIATEDEGLRDPDLMSGWWRNSGIRIYWAQRVRGPIVRPLAARLVEEIEQARRGGHYAQRDSALPARLLAGLRRLVLSTLASHDLYACQNLLILGDEFGLDETEQAALRKAFFDPAVSTPDFIGGTVEALLGEARLALEPAARSRSVLYRVGEGQPRDATVLAEYRDAALERERLRRRLEPDAAERDGFDQAREQVLSLYRELCARGPGSR